MNTFKYLFFATILTASLSPAAHDADGLLPPNASGSQLWKITCSNDGNGDPTTLEVSLLNNTSGGPMVNLQVITEESTPKYFNIGDPQGGDKKGSAVSTGYGGSHYILANKNAAGIAAYHFAYHCMSDNDHTGTSITSIQ